MPGAQTPETKPEGGSARDGLKVVARADAGAGTEHARGSGTAGACIEIDRWLAAMKSLQSIRCLCGREKRRLKPFCGFCFHLLPLEMQFRLYKPIGRGFEAAYEAAAQWLVREEE
jgi:hypothetical protein